VGCAIVSLPVSDGAEVSSGVGGAGTAPLSSLPQADKKQAASKQAARHEVQRFETSVMSKHSFYVMWAECRFVGLDVKP